MGSSWIMILTRYRSVNQPYSPFTKKTTDIINTDFRHHNIGSNPYDFTPGLLFSGTYEIRKDGFVSNNSLYVTSSVTGFNRPLIWNVTPSVATDNQEILILVEPLIRINLAVSMGTMGAALKIVDRPQFSVTNMISTTLGVRANNVGGSQRYTMSDGSSEAGASDFEWSANTKYWLRLRLSSGNTHNRKVWEYGTAEPAYNSIVPTASTWPTTAGKAGITAGTAGTQLKFHWISVAYNGATAEFPP